MDCYIVRVYRHITHQNGQADEIAGLVEQVGDEARSKPFSTYKDLVEAIRDSFETDGAVGSQGAPSGKIQAIHSLRGRQ
jgi:hypothetical protein